MLHSEIPVQVYYLELVPWERSENQKIRIDIYQRDQD